MRTTSRRPLLGVAILFSILQGCSGAGGGIPPTPASSGQLVTGSVQVAVTSGTSAVALHARLRRPLEVSGGTTHAAVFIDHAATPAGSTTTCSPTTGTGTGCTISWSANLNAPASHTFTVETDNGSKVLDIGQGSYFIQLGNNNLGTGTVANGNPPLSLNPVGYTMGWSVSSCVGSTCTGSVSMFDAAFYSLVYTGAAAVPTEGNSPTSGNVLDNDGGGASDVTLTSSAPAVGTVTGTTQSPFSSYASGTLTLKGLDNSGNYTFTVACNASTTGVFGVNLGGATTPSGDLTAAELTTLSPVTYPNTINGTGMGNVFTCTSGTISATTGTIIVN